jgi:hypothetical protein
VRLPAQTVREAHTYIAFGATPTSHQIQLNTHIQVENPEIFHTQDGMCGYLLKLYGKGTHRVWRKKWFYLMEDRLCYTENEDTLGPIKYLPLDRIPVRPYPRGYKPDIGVSILSGNML